MSDDVADHGFLDNRLVLREPKRGHRSGTDALLLAAFARPQAGAHVLDAGAGAGAVALAVLSQSDAVTAILLEGNPAMAALAAHNVVANGFAPRAQVLEADLFDKAACRIGLGQPVDVVLSNPPFFQAETVRVSHHPQRAASHVLDGRGHHDWFRRLFSLARPGGRILAIHRPEALRDFLEVAANRAAVTLRFIHARSGEPATRVLLEAKLGSKAPMVVLPSLALHGPDGHFTREAENLHRGRWQTA
ncbi:methyltransferase [Lichenihabitans sp. Uapishka_5]|uniref:tRNA1(Val) (adenine(37)-N6)-methyltransferase n=1 Tax=Lichenihabitans sp. Uapishka_5 TaxID=3037302 RepID=UPI0029E7D1FE|nr:methyltransferase [Lichenihabitans sp. Uapishka_5]MDX7949633.1 methyltransferase [Lichenihabitans sp. Uapishka_5]